jgi:hypothetical protein
MICPHCKVWDVLDDDRFCAWCRQAVSASPPPPPPPPPPVKTSFPWLLLAGLIAVLAAILIGYRFSHTPPSVPPAIQYFSGDHNRIPKGQGVTLQWSVNNATRVTITPLLGSLPPKGDRLVTPQESTEYKLAAEGSGSSVTAVFRVDVDNRPAPSGQPPMIVSFTPVRSTIIRGESTELRLEVSGATRISIAPEVGTLQPGAQSTVVHPSQDTTYVLTAENAAGRTSSLPVTVRVGAPITSPTLTTKPSRPKPPSPPAIAEFSSDTQVVEYGDSLKLRWAVANATSVSIDPGMNPGNPPLEPQGGQVTVSPKNTTEYELTAEGPGGRDSKRLTVTVIPNIQSFEAVPAPNRCDLVILRWKVTGATRISINGTDIFKPYDMVPRPRQDTDYTFRADRQGGYATKVVTVHPDPGCRQQFKR